METGVKTDTALIFPGISAYPFAGIARFLLINPVARRLVADAEETLGYSLIDRYGEADDEYSEYARVAFLISCLALAEWAQEAFGVCPQICTGPSFGGTPAAVYSGALAFPDAVRMTALWGRYADEYFSAEHSDVVTQSFARVSGERLDEVLVELDERGEWHDVACYVDEDFHMLSVREGALEWLVKRLRAVGGLPLYTMRPPMHSGAFRPLRDRIERDIFGRITFSEPRIPVVSDHDGSLLESAAGLRDMLLDAIVQPVRWPAVVATLKKIGVAKVYVSGPDSLWGRVECTTRSFEVVAVKPETALMPRRTAISGQWPSA